MNFILMYIVVGIVVAAFAEFYVIYYINRKSLDNLVIEVTVEDYVSYSNWWNKKFFVIDKNKKD